MRRFAYFIACGLLFATLPSVETLPVLISSALLVAMGVALACAASGRFNALAVAAGAVGAFGSGALRPVVPAAAGALLFALAFGERSLRVRSPAARMAHVGISLVGGALAGQLLAAFSSSNVALWLVSIVVAVALSALPLLLDADDPKAFALDQIAREAPPAAAKLLTDAAELRRNSLDVSLEPSAKASVERSWDALMGLGEARSKLEKTRMRSASEAIDSVAKMLEEKMSAHLDALRKAFSAADSMKVFARVADDGALAGVAATGESLEEVSKVLLEYETTHKR
jgi:MFS family permease